MLTTTTRLKQYFANNSHGVLIHDNFCAEISNSKLAVNFKDPNILKEQLAAYEAEIERIGPNPFKA